MKKRIYLQITKWNVTVMTFAVLGVVSLFTTPALIYMAMGKKEAVKWRKCPDKVTSKRAPKARVIIKEVPAKDQDSDILKEGFYQW